jgi:hypothetical protein
LQEGLLLDDRTAGLVAHLITYNAELKVFAAIQINFDFQQGGSIKVSERGCTAILLSPAVISAFSADTIRSHMSWQ